MTAKPPASPRSRDACSNKLCAWGMSRVRSGKEARVETIEHDGKRGEAGAGEWDVTEHH